MKISNSTKKGVESFIHLNVFTLLSPIVSKLCENPIYELYIFHAREFTDYIFCMGFLLHSGTVYHALPVTRTKKHSIRVEENSRPTNSTFESQPKQTNSSGTVHASIIESFWDFFLTSESNSDLPTIRCWNVHF